MTRSTRAIGTSNRTNYRVARNAEFMRRNALARCRSVS